MLNCLLQCKYTKILLTVVLSGIFVPVFAVKQDKQISTVISAISNNSKTSNSNSSSSTLPNSSVKLDFSIAVGESWDARNKPSNMTTTCVTGDSITGFEYTNVTIKTEGGSFFSEAVIYFSNSNNGDNGLKLTAGAGHDTSGTASFNSDGIIDFTDNDLDDIVSLTDKIFLMQFYENVDDVENAIDAKFNNGTITVWGVNLTGTSTCPFLTSQSGGTNTNLSVEYTANQNGPLGLGDAVTFDIVVVNNGAVTATNVSLNNTFSDLLTFNSMSCDDGTSTNNIDDIAILNVNDISANNSLNCTLSAIIHRYGNVSNSVTVNADNDSNASDNSATAAIAGALRIVPINNAMTLLLMIFTLLFFARRHILKL